MHYCCKMLLLPVTLLYTFLAHAQIQVGPEIGIHSSNYDFKAFGLTPSVTPHTGLRVGLAADIPVIGIVHIAPAIAYTTNGFQYNFFLATSTLRVNSIEMPVCIMLQKKWAFIGAGGYTSINMGGTFSAPSISHDLKIGSRPDDDIEKADYGLKVLAGCCIRKHIMLQAHYQKGLVNLTPGGNADNSMYSFDYGATLCYLFNIGHK